MTEDPTGVSDQIVSSVIGLPNVQRIIDTAILVGCKGLKAGAEKTVVSLISTFSGYNEYLEKTYQRVGTVKTFANPNKPLALIDQFVDINLDNGDNSREFNQTHLRAELSKGSHIVVSALAGFGKSILLKYLALSLYESPNGKIPLFVELRDLNRISDPDLLSYIHATYQQTSNIDKEVFEKGLKKGIFCLFLDGFDEINFDHRRDIENQILAIARDFPASTVLVSGRPDPTFDSWGDFTRYQIRPMALEQVTALVENIECDRSLKTKFLKKLEGGLYEKHESFLSTPLLATLMMLTYQQNANIPDKMHLFYLRAYETLFDKHDTYKEQYERKRKSKLRIDEFSRLFSVFCLNTYLEEEFEFSHTSMLEAVDEAISYCAYDVSAEDVLFDLTESVCLIQLEGLFYSFVHRSFQEYFTAVFLNQCPEDHRDQFLDSFVVRPWDSVLPMLYEMSRDRIEAGYIKVKIDDYCAFVDHHKKGKSYGAMLARVKGIKIRKHSDKFMFWGWEPGEFSSPLYVVNRMAVDQKLSPSDQDLGDVCDNILGQYANINGYKYLEYPQMVDLDEYRDGDYETLSLSLDDIFDQIDGSLALKYFLSNYRLIKNYRDQIDDSMVIKQRFLTKVRGDRAKN